MMGRRLRAHRGLFSMMLPAGFMYLYRFGSVPYKGTAVGEATQKVVQLDNKNATTTSTATHTNTMDKKKGLYHDKNATQLDLFDPDDLDTSKQVTCGWEKCFYRSKSNYDQVGYLAARSSTGKSNSARRGRLKSLEGAWQLAEELRQTYDIKHFLISPPINVTVSKSLASRLNHNLKSETHRRNFNKKRFPIGSTAFIEKVKPAPKHTLLIGCKESKLSLFKRVVEKFALEVAKRDAKSFARHFNESFADLRDLLHHEPCLLYDFQVILDTKGNVYHLDFDRCFNMKSAKKKNGPSKKRIDGSSCFRSLDKMEKQIHQAIEKVQ